MKVLMSYENRKEYPDYPRYIPFDLLNEEWAKINHDQSLDKLNSRGGLDPIEAIAIIEKRKWSNMDLGQAISLLECYIDTYLETK